MGEESLRLAREDEAARVAPVIQRLLPEAVAGEGQLSPVRVPDGEGEHPVERRGQLNRWQVLREMRDDLRVAPSSEVMPTELETFPQSAVVVDLAVEGHTDTTVLRRDRRIAGRKIDDRQACLTDTAEADLERTGGVGPAVSEVAELGIGIAEVAAVPPDFTRDATHLGTVRSG